MPGVETPSGARGASGSDLHPSSAGRAVELAKWLDRQEAPGFPAPGLTAGDRLDARASRAMAARRVGRRTLIAASHAMTVIDILRLAMRRGSDENLRVS